MDVFGIYPITSVEPVGLIDVQKHLIEMDGHSYCFVLTAKLWIEWTQMRYYEKLFRNQYRYLRKFSTFHRSWKNSLYDSGKQKKLLMEAVLAVVL